MKVYVSNDSSARAVGADCVAAALAKVKDVEVVRTSSRGAFFLEPLVEIDTPSGRAAFANVKPDEAPTLLSKKPVPLSEVAFLTKQTRFTFANFGVTQPLDLKAYGFKALDKARGMDPQKILDEVKLANLRGRGGAAFPAGIKWQTTKDAPSDIKYVVANADEGDPGTYSDRMIMEGEPFRLIEGMSICARAVVATR
ncbi:MAG TPA: formate dehydrogenase, partial [Planctomycetota bacterium]|nr:formate dehydrogenase [Planctomycetota bacterium]